MLFLIGSIMAAVAQNFPLLLAGRSIQGIGGGGIMALCLIIFSDIIPLRQRPIYISFVQVSWAFGTITGPILGGAIVQHTTWRWIFYINFPFCVLGLVLVPWVVRLKMPKSSLWQKFLSVDWTGGALFVGSTTSVLLGITWGGVEYPWGSYHTLVPLILGIFGVGLTMVWEWKGAKNPFIRLSVFKSRSAAGIYTCAIVQGLIVGHFQSQENFVKTG